MRNQAEQKLVTLGSIRADNRVPKQMRRLALATLATIPLIGGCATLPEPRTLACADAVGPAITYSADGRTASTRIDVLTYNIEGLPFPARTGRSPYLNEIASRLNAMKAQGNAPDIIAFQEVFSRAASRAVASTDYPSLVSGPNRRSPQAENVEGALPGRSRILRGEVRMNLKSSGLAIASKWPIVESAYAPFRQGSCAGFDCLSNKGMLFGEVAIPGVPGTVSVFTTHMQARRASGVGAYRHLPAHFRQSEELGEFLRSHGDVESPTLLIGDFNMRNNEYRQDHFKRKVQLETVHKVCQADPANCEIWSEWPHEDQWRRVQNKHLYESGNYVRVTPRAAGYMFDGGTSGPVLSDHYGFRVIYELSWPAKGALPAPVCPVQQVGQLKMHAQLAPRREG